MGERARQRNDVRTADASLQSAHAASASLPDGGGVELRARTMLLQGQTLVMKADYVGARDATIEAAALGELGNMKSLVAKARLTEAWISNWSDTGRLDEFRRATSRAIEACRLAGDVQGELEARALATNELYAIGRLHEFVTVNLELLDQANAIGDAPRAAAILERLVNVESLRGNRQEVELRIAESLALASRHGLRNVPVHLLRTRGTETLLAGDIAGAELLYREFVRGSRGPRPCAGAERSHRRDVEPG